MSKGQQKPAQKLQAPLKARTIAQSVPVEPKPFNINDYAINGITKDEVLEFKAAFDIFDHSGSGRIEIAEVKQAFINLGFHHQSIFTENIFAQLEKKGTQLDFGEFIRIATGKLNEDYTLPQTNLVFSAFDPKTTGKFNVYDLKDAIRGIGQDIGDEEVEKIFRAADSDGDGYVTNEDFYNIVTKKAYK